MTKTLNLIILYIGIAVLALNYWLYNQAFYNNWVALFITFIDAVIVIGSNIVYKKNNQ